MSDILMTIAATLAKQGAPVLGSMIGTAVGGPAGAAIGGMAGKAIEALATALDVPAEPDAVSDALTKPGATETIASVEANAANLLPLWTAQLAMAAQAQNVELEKGFGSWNARRNFAHYTAWGMVAVSGVGSVAAYFLHYADLPVMAGIFGSSITLTGLWMAVNSGGKAVTDFAKEWKMR